MDVRLGGRIGEWLLTKLSHPTQDVEAAALAERDTWVLSTKVAHHFGPKIVSEFFANRVVLDYGCGSGCEAVTAALDGAKQVVGLDTSDLYLAECRERAANHGVADKCLFLHPEDDKEVVDSLKGKIDVVLSLDAFEHFADPRQVLARMEEFLAPGGVILVSFGPLWWHPRGSHMDFFCPIPWLQAFFTEETILRVRSRYRNDDCRSFAEAGLNKMTLAHFKKLVAHSSLNAEAFDAVPIRRFGSLARLPFFREFLTSVIRCRLRRSQASELANPTATREPTAQQIVP